MTIEAYPLCWPAGWKRTDRWNREQSKFKASFVAARDELMKEIGRLRSDRYYGDDVVLSSNVALRQDGLPLANQRKPEDPGVAVYFQYKGKAMSFACDKYYDVWENMVAIRKTIEAIRGIERWGASEMMERAFTGFTALADEGWWTVLDVDRSAAYETVLESYRACRSKHHPDKGGCAEKFDHVQRAWEQYKESRA
jgi:hypothetical protein